MIEKKKASPKKVTKTAVVKKKVKKPETVKPAEAQPLAEETVVAASPVQPRVHHHKVKKEKLPLGPKYYGTGRRKEAVAKVWLKPGSGKISFNGRDYSEYLNGRQLLEFQVKRPLVVTNTLNAYDVFAEVFGGGVPGQAGAVSLGIARALLVINPDFRIKLKRVGLLRRDPRMKERKKYGQKRARKRFQYSKR